MIKSFTIKDFKSYDNIGVRFDFQNQDSNKYRPVNIFYGTNGSGKSSIKEYLKQHPELTDGEKILCFDEKFVKERFENYKGMSAVSSGSSDQEERQNAETAIQKYEDFKTIILRMKTDQIDRPIEIPKVVHGKSLVFKDVYDTHIQESSFTEFFSFEKEVFKDFNNKKLSEIEINKLQDFISNFKSSINGFDIDEIKKGFLARLCDFNSLILGNCPDLLTCSVPCFYLYFSLTVKLEETRERNLLPKEHIANNEFFNEIDENKINNFFNFFIEKIEQSIDNKTTNLEALKNIKNPILVAQKINDFLASNGFFDIQLEVAEDKGRTIFLIKRTFSDDIKNNFQTLSEGEKHLLAFLYFYELCLGFDDFTEALNPKDRIILIDDPVTSMDSNVLYLVSCLVADLFAFARDARNNYVSDAEKYILRNRYIKQGLLFTHNAYFLREFVSRIKFKKDYMTLHHIYKIVKNGKYVSQQKYVPVFKDEYSLLWDTFFSLKNDRSDSLTYLMPNICRRILESYGKFEGLENSNSLSDILDNLSSELPDGLSPNEITIYRSMINCLNNGSHYISATDDLYMQFRHIDYAGIFEKLFMKLDERHYRLKEMQYNNPR